MKYREKFSKFAWPSRLSAQVIKVDLVIQCKRLPKKDLLSQADAFCVLWQVPNGYIPNNASGSKENVPSKLPGRQETEVGRTEVHRNCVEPVFKDNFRLSFKFNEEQTFVIRVYDEDLRYATDLKEHDYLGGCMFTLGQLMGAKGCTIAKRLGHGKSFMVITGNEIIDTREVLEFRFSCQDLVKQRSLVDQTKVLDTSNPYFRLEKLNKDDQSWEVVWKSEVVKDSLNPTWREARLPLQLLCNDDQDNPLKITIWDYEKHSKDHDHLGFVESTVRELVSRAQDGVTVFMVMREKKKIFGGSKLKRVGLLKVLKSNVIEIPSMFEYLSGGCSLDVMLAIDCTLANGELKNEKSLHFSASRWLNDYQAGIQKLGMIVENFARGRHSSMWGFGLVVGEDVKQVKTIELLEDKMCLSKEMLQAYDKHIIEDSNFELGPGPAQIRPVIHKAMFRAISASQRRQCYNVLIVFTAGDIVDLQDSIDLICTAAEDAPLSIVIIGVGNRDFSEIEKLCGEYDQKGKLRDSRGVPIARDILQFVSFKRFSGNASAVISEALKDIPEQFVEFFSNNGTKPFPKIEPPDFGSAIKESSSSSPSPNGLNHKKTNEKKDHHHKRR
jgi:copine 1/2/3